MSDKTEGFREDTNRTASSVSHDDAPLSRSQEMLMSELGLRLKQIHKRFREYLRKQATGTQSTVSDKSPSRDGGLSQKYSEAQLSDYLKNHSENLELGRIMDLVLQSRRKPHVDLDPQHHLFQSLQRLEEQLRKKSKEAERYKHLYLRNKKKLEESEAIKEILKKVISIQKNAFLSSKPVKSFNATSSPSQPSDERPYYRIYRKIQKCNCAESGSTAVENIRTLLKSKTEDVHLYDASEIEHLRPEGLFALVEMILNEYCKLKRAQAVETEKPREKTFAPLSTVESEYLLSVLKDTLEKFGTQITKALSKINDQNAFEEISSELSQFLQSFSSQNASLFVGFGLNSAVDNFYVKFQQVNDHKCFGSQQKPDFSKQLDSFTVKLSDALSASLSDILSGIFMSSKINQNISETSLNTPISSNGIINLQLLPSDFSETVGVLNNFLSTLIQKAHTRYTKSIRIWADSASENQYEIANARDNFARLSSLVSELEVEGEEHSDSDVISILENRLSKLNELKELNTRLKSQLNEKEELIEALDKHVGDVSPLDVIFKVISEYLGTTHRKKHDSDTEAAIRTILGSFSSLLNECVGTPSLTVEVANQLKTNSNSLVESIDSCVTSLSSKMTELKTVVESYELLNDQHLNELHKLNVLLDQSAARVEQLEEELESRICGEGINTEVLDSTEKITYICDTVLKYSSDLLQRGRRLSSAESVQPMPLSSSEIHHSDSDHSFVAGLDELNQDLDSFLQLTDLDLEQEQKISSASDSQIQKLSIDACSRVQRLEEALERLQKVGQDFVVTQKLYEQCSALNDKRMGALIHSINLFSTRQPGSRGTELPPPELMEYQPTIEASDPQTSQENLTQLSFTPMGPILRM